MAKCEEVELRKQLDGYLASGFIRPSQSPYGAGVLFAKKHDGSMRLCVDYRALNSLTVKDSYPMSRIDEALDNMSGCAYFTKLDLRSGYHQIRVHDEHVSRTAFRTPFGSFEFLVMPFGLCNAPATFQRAMNQTFADALQSHVKVYLDDIVVHSKTFEEHLVHLKDVLSRLRANKWYGRLDKCEFAQPSIELLWFCRKC